MLPYCKICGAQGLEPEARVCELIMGMEVPLEEIWYKVPEAFSSGCRICNGRTRLGAGVQRQGVDDGHEDAAGDTTLRFRV